MTQLAPVHVPADSPDTVEFSDPVRGTARFRTLIDGAYGPTAGLVQGVATVPAGTCEKRHSHDIAETIYVLGGQGQAQIENRTLTLNPGDTVFIPAGIAHGWEAGSEDLSLLFTFPADRFSDVAFHFEDAA